MFLYSCESCVRKAVNIDNIVNELEFESKLVFVVSPFLMVRVFDGSILMVRVDGFRNRRNA